MPVESFKVVSSRKSAKGAQIDGLLYLPEPVPSSSTGPIPCIVMCSGIGTINSRTTHLVPFAAAFTAAGYAAATFDYVGFGASEGEPRNVLRIGDELADTQDVLAWVRGQKERFDADRLVLWGSSFGGMHVAATIASDHGLAAAIAQCPLVDGLKASLQLPVGRSIRLGAAAVADLVRTALGGKPVYVPLYSNGAKGSPAALMTGKHVVEGWKRVYGNEEFENYPNYIAARIGLELGLHRPVNGVKKSTCPFLVVLPEWDEEASLSAAEKAAKLAPKGESLRVTGGHFDLYHGGPGYEKNIAGQLEFLKRVLEKPEIKSL